MLTRVCDKCELLVESYWILTNSDVFAATFLSTAAVSVLPSFLVSDFLSWNSGQITLPGSCLMNVGTGEDYPLTQGS